MTHNNFVTSNRIKMSMISYAKLDVFGIMYFVKQLHTAKNFLLHIPKKGHSLHIPKIFSLFIIRRINEKPNWN